MRIGARRDPGRWVSTLLVVVAGTDGVQDRRWAYREALVLQTVCRGTEAAAALQTRLFSHAGTDVHLSLSDPAAVYARRRQSGAPSPYGPCLWPSDDHDLGMPGGGAAPGSDPLIGADSPSFVGYPQAAAAFFGVDAAANSNHGSAAPCLRFPDRTARIEAVIIGPAELAVTVVGDRLDGLFVELAGNTAGPTAALVARGPSTIRFGLPDGLPAGAWVLIRDADDWIDRRFLGWPHVVEAKPGVAEEEPGTDVDQLVAAGEGPAVEFKRELPQDRDARRKVARTVAAFANADGGTVLFGVGDDGAWVGLELADRSATEDTVTRWVADIVAPVPDFLLSFHDGPGRARPILALTVKPGPLTPYGVGPDAPVFYVRRGATTFPAQADLVRALARSRPNAEGTRLLPFVF